MALQGEKPANATPYSRCAAEPQLAAIKERGTPRHYSGMRQVAGVALLAADVASTIVGASTRRVRGYPATERSCVTTTSPKRSGMLGNPTALAEVDRGLPDGLKLVPNLGIGV